MESPGSLTTQTKKLVPKKFPTFTQKIPFFKWQNFLMCFEYGSTVFYVSKLARELVLEFICRKFY